MPIDSHSPNRAIVSINNIQLKRIEVGGEPVVTLSMIDKVHSRTDGTARKRFNDNRDRLREGEHFSKMSASVFRTRFPGVISARATEDVTLLSERGYLMLVKSFTDDLAWQVQDALVESYFKKVALPAVQVRSPRLDVARECRLAMSQNLKLARMIGLTGNQAALSANRATVAMTGVDTLMLMGATHITAPQNDALLTPTDIGKRTGIGSAQAVNQRLCDLGYQERFWDAKNHVYYEPTEAGKNAGAVMQDTGKHHGNGTPIRQLRWSSSVIDELTGGEKIAA